VQHPVVTLLETKSADCDDMAVAFAALVGSVGMPYGFRTVGVDPLDMNQFTHVYCVVHLDGRGWVPADPMFGDKGLGWEPPSDDPTVDFTRPRIGTVAWRRDWRA
jgi:transglutaminase-like putative cysteine protease